MHLETRIGSVQNWLQMQSHMKPMCVELTGLYLRKQKRCQHPWQWFCQGSFWWRILGLSQRLLFARSHFNSVSRARHSVATTLHESTSAAMRRLMDCWMGFFLDIFVCFTIYKWQVDKYCSMQRVSLYLHGDAVIRVGNWSRWQACAIGPVQLQCQSSRVFTVTSSEIPEDNLLWALNRSKMHAQGFKQQSGINNDVQKMFSFQVDFPVQNQSSFWWCTPSDDICFLRSGWCVSQVCGRAAAGRVRWVWRLLLREGLGPGRMWAGVWPGWMERSFPKKEA